MSERSKKDSASAHATQPSRVDARDIVSAPAKTIQVERISISVQQKSSIAAAIRAGKAAVAKSEKNG